MTKKIYPYEYSSVQLGKFFGITVKGIEYYEKKGLISPQRVGNGKDRRFNLKDTYKLFLSRYFKQSDFSLEEVRNIFEQDNIESIAQILKQKEKAIHKKELLLNAIDESIKYTSELLRKIAESKEPFIEVKDNCPDMKWLFVRNMNSPHVDDAQQLKEYKYWNELMPVTHGSLRYSKSDFIEHHDNLNPDIGMLVSVKNFNAFDFKNSDRVIVIKPHMCIHTIIIGDANEIKKDTWLRPVKQFIKDNNLKVTGDIITSFLLVKQATRYDEVWIPVEEI